MSDSGRLSDVSVRLRGKRRIESRHPWVFADDVAPSSKASHGDLVRVRDEPGKTLGVAFWSARSKIALRMVAFEDAVPDRAFWSGRVDAAFARRGGAIDAWQARRLLFGEGDDVPGLIADLYGTHLVVQALTAGAERVLPAIVDRVSERVPIDSVLARNDPSVRALEGLPREVRQIRGVTPDEIVVEEDPKEKAKRIQANTEDYLRRLL